jgi:hypothetical protein
VSHLWLLRDADRSNGYEIAFLEIGYSKALAEVYVLDGFFYNLWFLPLIKGS